MGAVSTARLRERIGPPVSSVVAAVVVGPDRRIIPESGIELTDLVLALPARGVVDRGAQRVPQNRTRLLTARWIREMARQPLEHQVPELCAERRECMLNELDFGSTGHGFDQSAGQRPGRLEIGRSCRCQRELRRDALSTRFIVAHEIDPYFAEPQTRKPGVLSDNRSFRPGYRAEELLRDLRVRDDPDWIWAAGKHVDTTKRAERAFSKAADCCMRC